LDLRGIGKITGAKGDSFEFTFTNRQSLINDRLVGKIDIIPGSGMGIFKDCSGSFKTVGEPDVSGIHLYVFTIEGELVFE
jgi:pectin methylesterase-like acyl-CoA thioesterase